MTLYAPSMDCPKPHSVTIWKHFVGSLILEDLIVKSSSVLVSHQSHNLSSGSREICSIGRWKCFIASAKIVYDAVQVTAWLGWELSIWRGSWLCVGWRISFILLSKLSVLCQSRRALWKASSFLLLLLLLVCVFVCVCNFQGMPSDIWERCDFLLYKSLKEESQCPQSWGTLLKSRHKDWGQLGSADCWCINYFRWVFSFSSFPFFLKTLSLFIQSGFELTILLTQFL